MQLHTPTRPLTAYPPGHGRWDSIWSIVYSLIFVCGFTLLMLRPIPDLISDWSIRQTARPIVGGHIEDGKCDTQLVLVDCSGALILRRPGEPEIRQKVSHYFVDFHSGDYTATVMADPANTAHLTTDLFLDKLWNRIVTLAVSIPLFGALAVVFVLHTRKEMRESHAIRAALSNKPMGLVTMHMESQKPRSWQLVSHGPGGVLRRSVWNVPKSAKPIVLDTSQHLVLGINSGEVHMPLDDKLKWLGLTKEERDAMLRELRAQTA